MRACATWRERRTLRSRRGSSDEAILCGGSLTGATLIAGPSACTRIGGRTAGMTGRVCGIGPASNLIAANCEGGSVTCEAAAARAGVTGLGVIGAATNRAGVGVLRGASTVRAEKAGDQTTAATMAAAQRPSTAQGHPRSRGRVARHLNSSTSYALANMRLNLLTRPKACHAGAAGPRDIYPDNRTVWQMFGGNKKLFLFFLRIP